MSLFRLSWRGSGNCRSVPEPKLYLAAQSALITSALVTVAPSRGSANPTAHKASNRDKNQPDLAEILNLISTVRLALLKRRYDPGRPCTRNRAEASHKQ